MFLSPEPCPPLVNVVHPQPVSWSDVFGAINDALDTRLPFIAYDEWLIRLEE